MVLDPLLQRERLARVAQQSARDPSALSLSELFGAVERSVWDPGPERRSRDAAIRRAVQQAFAGRLIGLAADTAAAPDVRAMVELTLERLGGEATARGAGERGPPQARAHWRSLARQIERWREEREIPTPSALPAPPGDPFGTGDE